MPVRYTPETKWKEKSNLKLTRLRILLNTIFRDILNNLALKLNKPNQTSSYSIKEVHSET